MKKFNLQLIALCMSVASGLSLDAGFGRFGLGSIAKACNFRAFSFFKASRPAITRPIFKNRVAPNKFVPMGFLGSSAGVCIAKNQSETKSDGIIMGEIFEKKLQELEKELKQTRLARKDAQVEWEVAQLDNCPHCSYHQMAGTTLCPEHKVMNDRFYNLQTKEQKLKKHIEIIKRVATSQ